MYLHSHIESMLLNCIHMHGSRMMVRQARMLNINPNKSAIRLATNTANTPRLQHVFETIQEMHSTISDILKIIEMLLNVKRSHQFV